MTVQYLLENELNHVMAALTPSNRLVCRLALHTGLRIGDVLALRTGQLRPHFWVTEAKTGKRRQIGIPSDLLVEILAQAGPVWAFPGRSPDRPRTRQAIWKDIKRAARAFRLPENVGCHSLRKVYAVRLMERYGDLERVRRALQHSSPSITVIYAMADKLVQERRRSRRSGRSCRRR